MHQHDKFVQWLRFIVPLALLALLAVASLPARAQDGEGGEPLPFPDSVTLAGTFQPLLGCPAEWLPECSEAHMTYDAASDIWRASFDLPAGEYEYKAALNDSWDDNYGLNAEYYGENIPLAVPEDMTVQFFYDHKTGWITDNINAVIANVPGSFQDEIGCPGEWAPNCLRTWLQDPDGDGTYSYMTNAIPAGSYEAKVAINESWDENYGVDGASGGANIPFEVPADGHVVTVTYDSASHAIAMSISEAPGEVVLVGLPGGVSAAESEPAIIQPDIVNIPGTLQPALGCPGEWQPDCEATLLELDETAGLWYRTFDLPAGEYEYKVAINGNWTENYGGNSDQDGPNIVLSVPEDMAVTFIYDHATHLIVDSIRWPILTVLGDFQDELGCAADNDPACLITYMQDADRNGTFQFSTRNIPAGDWQAAASAESAEPAAFTVPEEGSGVLFAYSTSDSTMTITVVGPGENFEPQGDLSEWRARWVALDTVTWDIDHTEGNTYQLNFAAAGGMQPGFTAMTGADGALELTVDPAGPDADTLAQFPHVEGHLTLRLNAADLERVPEILMGQVAVSAFDAGGSLIDATGLQIPGVVDDLYTTDAPLGINFDEDGVPSLSLWAPTARNVRLHLFDEPGFDAEATIYDMERGEGGVWSVTGEADWLYKFYNYEVEVFAPSTNQMELNLVTDPYAVSLSMNSRRSQIVNLNDPALMPDGWLDSRAAPMAAPEDIVIYELHVRDFSVQDATVPEEYRGTYLAFTVEDSDGTNHLRALAAAGLTHLHLLPTFDIATINENRTARERFEPDFAELASFAADSPEQQAIIAEVRDLDGFNWGYDPYHFNTPEGSYATDPDGAGRILEYRQMVQALNGMGLHVVSDVVYNHTNSSGQGDRAVFDRIVPGYYHRLDDRGRVATSTCCQNTATEHNMMERFMIDSVVLWATQYHIDAFRFDLMGHHMLRNMIAVREALNALTPEAGGVDGSAIYIYGEGWDFGEVGGNARGVNATQLNLGGVGIGTFNDRLRDAVRGGNPFGDYQFQGFINGLYLTPNGITPGDEAAQLTRLLELSDHIRIGMAGNLANYLLENGAGETVPGSAILYNGSPAGYTLDPQENIVYISKHDNETLFDIIQYKAPEDATMADRVRMQNLGLDIVMFSQGVPFFHAGSDMLRSKSLDRNSYNSGDWFNHLDFSYQTSNWGIGLPMAGDNESQWPIQQPLLAREDLRPTPEDILFNAAHFQEILQIRRSSPLFRLQSAGDVMARLVFHNTGPDQMPGVIVMSLSDLEGDDLDPDHELVVVVINAQPGAIDFSAEAVVGLALELHPLQAASSDPVVQQSSFDDVTGTFTVPGRTTAVFVLPE